MDNKKRNNYLALFLISMIMLGLIAFDIITMI